MHWKWCYLAFHYTDPFADTDPRSISLDIPRIDFENLAGNDILFDIKDSDDEEYENGEVVEFEGNDIFKHRH